MMLEQSLISPNFLGKESFRWFIGITTKYKQVENGGYKAKVRIIGHHPDAASVIKDEELPWAHVLVPLNMGAGEGGTGVCFNSRGSETVIGFFMDGDNGQQPVIIGSIFSGYDIKHPNKFNQGTNGFNPFEPDKSDIKNPNNRSSKTGRTPSSGVPNTSNNVGVNSTNPKGDPSCGKIACDIGGKYNTVVVSIPPTCKSSKTTYSKIIKTLRDFIKTLRTVQQVQSGFIDPALNTIQNIPGLVQEATLTLSDLFNEYLKVQRDKIIAEIQKELKKTIEKFLPKDVKLFEQLATDKIVDSIWCAFNKVSQKIGEFIFNFLTQLVGAVTNVPICAAQAFVGSILNTITNEVTDAIAPTLEEFSSQFSGVIGQISSYTSQALVYANQALSFLSCESAECKQSLDYEMNKGYIPQETIDNVQGILSYPSTSIRNGKEAARKWLGIVGSNTDDEYSYLSNTYGYCDAVNLECGLPIIQFFGGAGDGALGLAVVDALGQMMGIYIQNEGTGYSSPPYVSIQDPCDSGSGAVVTANVEDGKVVSTTTEKPGSGYVGPSSVASPCDTYPVDSSGSSVVGTIVGVKISNTGIGYSATDLITDSACASDVKIYPVVDSSGRIIDVNIVNPGSAIKIYPRLTINTQDGEGAILQPILTFKPVEEPSVETNVSKIKKVVLCAEDHV